MLPITQSEKLRGVHYDVRGPILTEAMRLEQEGHEVLKLNLGNLSVFGFDAPDEITNEVIAHMRAAQAYSDSRGLAVARQAVADYYSRHAIDAHTDDVFLGNGVSELITLVLQAFVNTGDEILVPAPDYPTWTGAVTLAGGTPVHYLCDEAADWMPDINDIESKITERTRALVIINPNNPTGAVYSEKLVEQLAEVARRHDLVVMTDEIYEKVTFDGVVHHHMARSTRDDVLCLTFGGLSKAFRVCGYRSGWVVTTGPRDRAADFLEGITLLTNMRVSPNVPAQYAIPIALSDEHNWTDELMATGGPLHSRLLTATDALNAIAGVSCVRPSGALYCFPRIDPEVYQIDDDRQFALDLLRSEHVLITPGTGFNWPDPDHFRMVFLAAPSTIIEATERIERCLQKFQR